MKMEDDRDNPFARILMQSYERNLQSTGQGGDQNHQPPLIQEMMATPNHHGTGTAGGHHQQFGTGDGHPSTSSLSQTHSVNLMMLNSNQPSAAASSDGLPNNQLLNSMTTQQLMGSFMEFLNRSFQSPASPVGTPPSSHSASNRKRGKGETDGTDTPKRFSLEVETTAEAGSSSDTKAGASKSFVKKLHILVNGGVRTRPTSKATLQLLSNSGFGEQSFEFLLSDDAGQVVDKILSKIPQLRTIEGGFEMLKGKTTSSSILVPFELLPGISSVILYGEALKSQRGKIYFAPIRPNQNVQITKPKDGYTVLCRVCLVEYDISEIEGHNCPGAPTTSPVVSTALTGIRNGIPTGTPDGTLSGNLTSTPTGSRLVVSTNPTGIRNGIPTGTPDSTPSGTPGGTPYGTPDGTPYGTPDGTPSGTLTRTQTESENLAGPSNEDISSPSSLPKKDTETPVDSTVLSLWQELMDGRRRSAGRTQELDIFVFESIDNSELNAAHESFKYFQTNLLLKVRYDERPEMTDKDALKLFYCRLAEQVKVSLTSDASIASPEEESACSTAFFGGFMMGKMIEEVPVFPYFVWELAFEKINPYFVNGFNKMGIHDVLARNASFRELFKDELISSRIISSALHRTPKKNRVREKLEVVGMDQLMQFINDLEGDAFAPNMQDLFSFITGMDRVPIDWEFRQIEVSFEMDDQSFKGITSEKTPAGWLLTLVLSDSYEEFKDRFLPVLQETMLK